ncbi:tail sheath monomer [Escherichia phage vB_EcoM_005]|uniref:Tail sheath monomer n=1 Tax=Escherichia phage vB_EcoM_005 TaxID=2500761 RepID=A0A3T0ILR6_9CAUD|nr:tail sheath monomer [Escherichia phage vB_EcoM_005]AZV00998.1 tail sheath monomer [Escherichia phage vB_EcoM_005]
MNGPKTFNSQARAVGGFAQDISNDMIKNEPMFFNCDAYFAHKHGGPITRSFIENLPEDWQCGPDIVFDSRVHMLMPGWYPAIPGFHHDDVPRPDIPVGQHFITAGQPDYDNPRYHSEHILGLVNAGIESNELTKWDAPDRTLLQFDWQTWHTGSRAVSNGWRWFGRVSRNTDRVKKITNEIRVNAQVYLEFPMEGW